MNLTKILPPRPVNILGRERLANKLRAWEDKKLVVIHGQAGQGKSTLAADYVHSLPEATVWYNMDQEDENPAVFLSCLGQAMQRSFPRHLTKLPVVPQNRYGAGGMYRSFSRWIDQVFGSLPDGGLVVFDDYNLVSAPYSLKPIFKALIDSTPPHIRFMLISRTQPDLEVARLRARRAVGEIAGDELKFNDTEVQTLFSDVFGMHLGVKETAMVNQMAEGWAAGLVLMHEYLASARSSLARPLSIADHGPAGFQNHVFDYLAQEVFSHLPSEMQEFLLRTSIVDYLPEQLMELLTGLPPSAPRGKPSTRTLVEELRKRNLFITALDDGATVVRYHALFRGFLRKKLLAQAMPGEVKKLYTLAAEYFRKAGDPVRTVNLCIESGQFEKAVTLIEACCLELIARGQTQTLLRWIEALPLDYGERPWFLFTRAVSCRFTDPRRALTLFDRAFGEFKAGKGAQQGFQGKMLSLGGIIEACFYTGGDFKRMERAAVRARTLLRQSARVSPESKARLLLALGTACFFIGRLREGAAALSEALDLFRKTGDAFYQIQSAIYLAPCSIYLGDFRLAREAVKKGFLALTAIPDETGGEAALSMAQAMTALFEGNFAEAQESIDRCSGLAHAYDLEAFDFLSLNIGGWLKIATGDHEAAQTLLGDCKRKGREMENSFFTTSACHLLSISELHQGRLDAALAECTAALTVRARSGSRLFYAVSLAARGVILTRLGKYAQAGRDLSEALRIFRQIGAAQQEANVHLALAVLKLARKKTAEIRRHIRAAFALGEERGFTYFHLFTPQEVADIAKRALAEGICTEYCTKLLAGRGPAADAPPVSIYCLGGFRVLRGKTEVSDGEWKSRRAKALIKFLVSREGTKTTRDAAMDALLTASDSVGAAKAFSSLLYRLRKLLDPDGQQNGHGPTIAQEGDLVMLNPDGAWTDTHAFRAHLSAAKQQSAEGNTGKALEEYERALALYQGDFLPEDMYEDWATLTRDSLRTAFLMALDDVAVIADSLGDRDKAAAARDRLFQADPCNERSCRWLMAWHAGAGRRSDAIRVFERCQRSLSRELDVEPDEKTKNLYRSMIER